MKISRGEIIGSEISRGKIIGDEISAPKLPGTIDFVQLALYVLDWQFMDIFLLFLIGNLTITIEYVLPLLHRCIHDYLKTIIK